MRKIITCIFLLFVINTVLPVNAQWNIETQLNNAVVSFPLDQQKPVMCSDGAGGTIIAYYSKASVGFYEVFVQRLNSEGTALWNVGNGGVALFDVTNNDDDVAIGNAGLDIMPDGAGGAFIVYTKKQPLVPFDPSNIHLARVNSAGVVSWNITILGSDVNNSPQLNPKVVSDGASGCIVVWQDGRTGTANVYDIYAQRVNSAGVAQWGGGATVNAAVNSQELPQAVPDGTNGVIVTWRDFRSGTNYDLYAQRLNNLGTRIWTVSGEVVSTAVANQNIPKIVLANSTEVIIAWQDFRSGTNTDIYAQKLAISNGAAGWTANGVQLTTDQANNQNIEGLIADGSGGAFFNFIQAPIGAPDATTNDLHLTHVDNTGALVAGWAAASGNVVCNAALRQGLSSVTQDGSGGCILAWSDERDGTGGNEKIFSQRFNGAGVAQWAANGVLVSNAPGEKSETAIISDGCISIICWEDYKAGGTAVADIYASSLKCDGTMNSNNFQFRSANTGNWTAAASWEMFNGSSWVTATRAPNNNDGTVTIRNGNTITINSDMSIDNVVIDAGSALTISIASLVITNGQAADDILCNGTLTIGSGFISGAGKITINGTLNWQQGFLETPVQVNSGGILNKTNNLVFLGNTLDLNTGAVMNWSAGSIELDNGTINNSGSIIVSAFLLLAGPSGINAFNNLSGGTFSVASSSRITFGVPVNNQGILKGTGLYEFSGNAATLSGNGSIAPGNSPGIVSFDMSGTTAEIFNNSGKLEIEMQSGSGPGTGHDELLIFDNVNLVLRGNLTVTETGTVPDGTYTIINFSSGTISGSFTPNLPSGYTVQVSGNLVQLVKNSSTAPLRFVSFIAKKQNSKALLEWVTENEENTSHFDIERSKDGRNFEKIGMVSSFNTPGSHGYRFTDMQPAKGMNYYRLRQVDIDARSAYSKTARVNFDSKYSIVISPNPASDKITIDGAEDFKIVQFVNMEGKLVKQFTISDSRQYAVTDLPAGVYILKLMNDEEAITQKFIKQ
jgi:hypothetical protein